MNFLSRSKASGCFLLTNFIITLPLESILYLKTGIRLQPSLPFDSISKREWWQMSITTFSRLSSGILFGIPDNSMLLRRLHCSDLDWYFSRLMIRSSSFVFSVSSLLIFSFVECSWYIVSFSFNIWLQRLDMS